MCGWVFLGNFLVIFLVAYKVTNCNGRLEGEGCFSDIPKINAKPFFCGTFISREI